MIVVALFLHVSDLSSHREVHIHKAVLCPHQPTAHTPSGADLGGPVIVPVTLVTVPLSNNGAKNGSQTIGDVSDYTTIGVEFHLYCRFAVCVGTYIHWVLLFAWLLLFRKWITGLIGTYIHRVLVIDGYLYSRVYGIKDVWLYTLACMCTESERRKVC